MSRYKDVRRGVSQAELNEDAANIFYGEIMFIAIIAGIYMKSWWVFGGLLIGMLMMMSFRITAILLCTVLTIAWGIIGWKIGSIFGNGANWVLSVIAFFLGAGIHYSALEWTEDVNYYDED